MHPEKEMEALVQAVEASPEVMTYPRPRNEMEALVEAIEHHPEVMNHPMFGNKTIGQVKDYWKIIAKELNARRIFRSVLSGEDARRKWADLKYRTKKKAKGLKGLQSKAGGGMPNEDSDAYFSLIEKRVMDLIKNKRIKAPTTSQNEIVSSIPINESTPSLDSVLPPGHVIIKARSSSINSSLQPSHFIVHASSPSTLPSGHILIQTSTPILSVPTSTTIIPDKFPSLSAHTPIITPDSILTDACTVQTAANIKEEMFEIGEVETEPSLDDVMDEINSTSPERVLCKNNNLYINRRSKGLIKKRKKLVRKTEFDMLADIEERKMALLEEQIKIKREHLKFQEKKTLIMERQLSISKEQLAVSKEQLAVSKQILQFKINQGS